MELASYCFAEIDSDCNLEVLKGIEVEVIENERDRLMSGIKIGNEGYMHLKSQLLCLSARSELESERYKKPRSEEIARRMLADNMAIEAICRMTGLTRREVSRLNKKQAG